VIHQQLPHPEEIKIKFVLINQIGPGPHPAPYVMDSRVYFPG